jgi:hypothetical protein
MILTICEAHSTDYVVAVEYPEFCAGIIQLGAILTQNLG